MLCLLLQEVTKHDGAIPYFTESVIGSFSLAMFYVLFKYVILPQTTARREERAHDTARTEAFISLMRDTSKEVASMAATCHSVQIRSVEVIAANTEVLGQVRRTLEVVVSKDRRQANG